MDGRGCVKRERTTEQSHLDELWEPGENASQDSSPDLFFAAGGGEGATLG